MEHVKHIIFIKLAFYPVNQNARKNNQIYEE